VDKPFFSRVSIFHLEEYGQREAAPTFLIYIRLYPAFWNKKEGNEGLKIFQVE
jgi:hypothetical protein